MFLKRMSSYNFKMGEAKGVAWIHGVLKADKQMLDEQRLTGEFDTVVGVSNSIQQSMIPLAKELEPFTNKPSNQKFYSIAEDLGKGITGRLKVIVEDGKIISCRYDEIFADSPENIKLPRQKNSIDNQNMKVLIMMKILVLDLISKWML